MEKINTQQLRKQCRVVNRKLHKTVLKAKQMKRSIGIRFTLVVVLERFRSLVLMRSRHSIMYGKKTFGTNFNIKFNIFFAQLA